MKLIVNGDDFGLTKGVSEGIIKAIKEGIMTDTSAMANMPYFEEAIKMAKDNGITEMGIHLTLTCGKPVLQKDKIKSIVDNDGNFFKKPCKEVMCPEDAEKEIRAQIHKFLSTGMKLNHIDAHHHFYVYNQEILNIVINIAKEYNVPMRCLSNETINMFAPGYSLPLRSKENDAVKLVRKQGASCPDHLIVEFYDEGATEENLIGILKNSMSKYEVLEIMSHPAIVDEELLKRSSYNNRREEELKVLISERVRNFINNNNIELISFTAL